ncbi:oxidoreductase [Agarivorans sp. Toyoura001]|uniref:aldo/keto reductase n=1 Tax=Agarivorans sp. Toyoura001 TaxID=2283141 RepID=UPI0010F273A9|nr:aldo/keto reductase [Agarivorans sp. Toyoura001]GDY24759.1 oxidoreductase [Agarivorans sp. Toyoura001]
MEMRQLGPRQVSPMGLGCWAIGGPFYDLDNKPCGWGEVDDKVSIRAIHAGIDAGINFFDTAAVYGAGHSEQVLGQALEGKREKIVLATKFGVDFDSASKSITGSFHDQPSIIKHCEASLKRLNTDYIDVYQLHLNDLPLNHVDEVLLSLEKLVETGKIRRYGWSTDHLDRAEAFSQGKHCAAIQFQNNVLDQNTRLTHFCFEHKLAAINRGPLAMGLLSGKYHRQAILDPKDIRNINPEWLKYFNNGKASPALLSKLEGIQSILTSNGRTLIQGALAWIWGSSSNTLPIPGFRTVEQVVSNAEAIEHGALSTAQMREIKQLLN